MQSTTQDSSQNNTVQNSAQELTHITEEIYKKNTQLAESNKVLSLLHQLDEVVLGSITNINEIAQQITNITTIQTDLKGMIIMTFDSKKQYLLPLAINQAKDSDIAAVNLRDIIDQIRTPLSKIENPIIQTLANRKKSVVSRLDQLFIDEQIKIIANKIQNNANIKTILIYPLVARGGAFGVIILLLNQLESEISDFKKEFLAQLPQIIGIALDNALLFKATQEANEKLKQLDKLKDDFVSLASHELRTPMTVIRSYLWMAVQGKAGELNPKQKFYLDRAYSSTVRLINLVNEMLNISRIESGRMSVNMQKTNLGMLVNEIVFELKVRARELGLTLEVAPGEIPPVLADADKIKEVLLNLIGNSFKFTPRGGSITLSFETKDDFVYIHVKDTGIGIKPEEQEKLFQKFSMIGTSYKVNKTDVQGTGLGLYISKSIIELHKGTVSAYSEGEGKGSTFTFSLKIYSDADFAEFQKEFGDKEGLDVIHSSIS